MEQVKELGSALADKVSNALYTGIKAESDSYPQKVSGSQQQSEQPGLEHEMTPEPIYDAEYYKGSGKLQDQAAIITGGDSGIGRSVSILYAREGADVAIVYLPREQKDAEKTKTLVEKEGRRCLLLPGDVASSAFCKECVDRTVQEFGKLNILVNNAALQFYQESVADITDEQLERTFRVNIFAHFYFARSALPHLEKTKGCIINTTSVTMFKGKDCLLDYSSTKGAITAFTRSLSQQLADKGIRVNGVAPGPIWTPLIPSSFPTKNVEEFGQHSAIGRPGQPFECATAYVFLASKDSSYFSGQILHPNGGAVVNA
ncbi:hypothetical protein AKO1_014622 [Acrasis kona]|uniref:Uncharacterized protein n=1 Tax=Acrasis kona TaxID=1008807 RepID=A0AAW2Z1Z8_9EUKA